MCSHAAGMNPCMSEPWDSPKGYTQGCCRHPPPSPGDYNDKHVSWGTGSRKLTRCTGAVPWGGGRGCEISDYTEKRARKPVFSDGR